MISCIGVVVIGRNEGQRLVRCLESISKGVGQIVYVDSGSTDGSLAVAIEAGAVAVELDLARPFTAARARNAGLKVLADNPQIQFVQFVDGDCSLNAEWLDTACEFIAQSDTIGVVCGRRREILPNFSVYNRLCDQEWDTPVGQARSCGGDAMMRLSALKKVGGYRETMIAGEEPELCVRLRTAGWEVWRLDAEMTLHDAAMSRFSQWWKRAVRSGHAFAEGAALHGAPPERHNVEEITRILKWSLGLPFVILFLSFFVSAWALSIALVYPMQIFRLAQGNGITCRLGWERAFFLTLGNFPETLGILKYHWRRWRRKPAHLIEYK